MSTKLKDTTQTLVSSILYGFEVTPSAKVDFGIDSPLHFAAISDAVLSGRVDAHELDSALGNGKRLTELVNRLPDQPYKNLTFQTAWDDIPLKDRRAERVRVMERER